MNSDVKIISVKPEFAIPGAEIEIACEGYRPEYGSDDGCYLSDTKCRTVTESTSLVVAVVPENTVETLVPICLTSRGDISDLVTITVGRELVDGMHIVANPAVDPETDAIVLTRSGSRGQEIARTVFFLEPDGFLDESAEPMLNPTGIAFDQNGRMFVSNRAQGEVYEYSRDGSATLLASGLGIATGIAFSEDGTMYVGDRSGTIFIVHGSGDHDVFATLEPAVSAYHLAFGPDGRLYVTAPGLVSNDKIYAVGKDGEVSEFARGFGRPQGLAFDTDGYLYVAACCEGTRGIFRITPDGRSITPFIAGNGIVGMCFDRSGKMIVATNEKAFAVECGLAGTLL